MSENRFKLAYEKGNEAIFEDLAKYPYPRRLTNKEVERKLNEQQTTIEKLEKENEQLRKDKEQIKEKSTKNEELIQRKLTNVLLARIYVAQLSLNPNLPYVGQSLDKEMQLLDKKIRELCGDVFNE